MLVINRGKGERGRKKGVVGDACLCLCLAWRGRPVEGWGELESGRRGRTHGWNDCTVERERQLKGPRSTRPTNKVNKMRSTEFILFVFVHFLRCTVHPRARRGYLVILHYPITKPATTSPHTHHDGGSACFSAACFSAASGPAAAAKSRCSFQNAARSTSAAERGVRVASVSASSRRRAAACTAGSPVREACQLALQAVPHPVLPLLPPLQVDEARVPEHLAAARHLAPHLRHLGALQGGAERHGGSPLGPTCAAGTAARAGTRPPCAAPPSAGARPPCSPRSRPPPP